MSILTLSAYVRDECLDFAWRQWRQLGLSGYGGPPDPWAIDPEGLIHFTLEVGRHDPRLFDEMLDWIAHNNGLLSLQRLRNLCKHFPSDPALVNAVLSWVAQANPTVRWPKSPPDQGIQTQEPRRLFPEALVSFIAEPDPVFAKHGILRPVVSRSGKSTEPDPDLRSNLGLRLRLLFGAGARADIIRVLLTQPEGALLDASHIATEAGFAKRNVSDALNAMSKSGVVLSRWDGNQRVYFVYRDKWADLLGVGPGASSLPHFRPWVRLLSTLLEVGLWLDHAAHANYSDYMLTSRANDLLERMRPGIGELVDHPIHVTSPPRGQGWDNLELIVRRLVWLLQSESAASPDDRTSSTPRTST